MNIKHTYPFLFLFLFLTCSVSHAQLADIEMAIIQQDYTSAQARATELLAGNPDKKTATEARYYLALSELRLGEYAKANKTFKDVIDSSSAGQLRDKAYLGYFDAQYLQKQYPDALATIKQVKKLSPRSEFLSLIALKEARVNLKLANWDEAHNILERIVQKFPDSFEAYTAKQLLEEKQYFAVQVGSFLEQERAQKLANELNRRNEYAYIVETKDKDNREFFRVRVGQFSALDEAERLKSRLAGEGYPTQIYP